MRLSILAFTKNGIELAKKVESIASIACPNGQNESDGNSKIQVSLSIKSESAASDETLKAYCTSESITEWATRNFTEKSAMLFIGSTGIAVRAIAPGVKDKLTDSPVLVMDEQGQFVISLLSGHVGGANELAQMIADAVGAIPVITTATDLNDAFSVDLFAKEQGLTIANRDAIKRVSTKAIEGKPIRIAIENFVREDADADKLLDEADVVVTSEPERFLEHGCLKDGSTIVLCPKRYAVGIGCKKDKPAEDIEAHFMQVLSQNGIKIQDVGCICSIDVKANEAGILALSEKYKLPFITFSAELLQQMKGDFTPSEFVASQVGVDNVCERSAMAAVGRNGRIIIKKTASNGVTIAVAEGE